MTSAGLNANQGISETFETEEWAWKEIWSIGEEKLWDL